VPELPEVETVRAQLAPLLVGRRLETVDIRDPRLTRPLDPEQVARELEGERVESLRRRGKYLLLVFESGRVLLVHFRMTGSLRYETEGSLEHEPHVRALMTLDDASQLVYRDVRRFGTWVLLDAADADLFLAARVGEEPVADRFTAKTLERSLATRKTPVKAALLDQRLLAGLGNIYADEALWRARVNPLRRAGELTEDDIRRLHRGIRQALRVGIARQGATLRDYRAPDGAEGLMQDELKVYGREGLPCPRCETPIEKERVAGRGTYYCPRCQPLSQSRRGDRRG
jgi:formamidopyrimidine-DNA glycosylase